MRRRGWLLALCLGLLLAAPDVVAQPAREVIEVARPAAGETLSVEVPPGALLALDFDLGDTRPERDYPDLLLLFDDGGRVVLRNLMLDEQADSVEITFAGITIPAYAVAGAPATANGHGAEPPPKATKPRTRNGGVSPDLADLRHTGRDLLFAGETERGGHPLYSYLLFAGAREGAREERLRLEAAIEAYIGQVSSASALEASGAEPGEINIFYVPVTVVVADAAADAMRQDFAQHSSAEQVALLLEHYDHARAEVLLGRMQLAGNGPYIVSLLRPLTREAVGADEAFLVQDLSHVPPQLVALWIDEFKRQVVREATESPEHLRRLALALRTEIAVLAEAFAITRTAVAEMFDESGGGN